MTDYMVPLTGGVDFAPENEVAEILQNVRTIIRTRVGTVPLERDFGVSWDHVDKPIAVARAMMMEEVIEAIQTYEPRATVSSVTFEETEEEAMEGRIMPRVTVSIADGYLPADTARRTASDVDVNPFAAKMAVMENALEKAYTAQQEAERASAAITHAYSRLEEIESTDYPSIYADKEE